MVGIKTDWRGTATSQAGRVAGKGTVNAVRITAQAQMATERYEPQYYPARLQPKFNGDGVAFSEAPPE